MAEVVEAISGFFDSKDEVRNQAEQFLISQIRNVDDFFVILFELYNHLPIDRQKFILILVKYQVLYNFQAVINDFQNFSERLQMSIILTENVNLLFLLGEIIFQVATKIDDVWPDFHTCICLYKGNIKFLPLSIYIFKSSLTSYEIVSKYNAIIQEYVFDIILNGLKFNDVLIQINATFLFSWYSREFAKDGLPNGLKSLYSMVYLLAQNSISFSEFDFGQFWSAISLLNTTISEPFFNLAASFLSQEVSSRSMSVLFDFIIENFVHLDPNDYSDFINNFFLLQLEIEDVDITGQIYNKFYKIDGSYETFKDIIISFISNPDSSYQVVGIENLQIFCGYYSTMLAKDTSFFIDLVLSIDSITNDNIFLILSFFKYLELNMEDSEKVFEFLINVITNFDQNEVQFFAIYIMREIKYSPQGFKRMIDIQSIVNSVCIPIYLSSLCQLACFDIILTNKKYDHFINLLIETYMQASQNCEELLPEYEQAGEEYERKNDLIFNLLLRGSSANLIVKLAFYRPLMLEEYVQAAIEVILSTPLYESLFTDESEVSFDFRDIEIDFSKIMKEVHFIYIDFIRPNYEFLNEQSDFLELKHNLIMLDGEQCPFAETYVNNFYEYLTCFNNDLYLLENDDISTIEYTIDAFYNFTLPMSKWLYRVPNEELHNKYLEYIETFFMRLGPKSPNFMQFASQVLINVFKPKRIKIYETNQIEWFPSIYEKACHIVEKAISDVIPNYHSQHYSLLFFAVANLCTFLLNEKNELAHQFFNDVVMGIYNTNSSYTEYNILVLFSEMLDNDFTSPSEIQTINETIDKILTEDISYHDNLLFVFEVITKMTKIDHDLTEKYFQSALNMFNGTEDTLASKQKSSLSLFLMNALNQDSEKYASVVGILPAIFSFLSVPTENKVFKLYLIELLELFRDKSNLFTPEAFEALIKGLLYIFAFQMNVAKIFELDEEIFDNLVVMLKGLLNDYIQSLPNATYQDVISVFLSDYPSSIEYILSLLQSDD